MDAVALMDRTDTKFLCARPQGERVFCSVADDYRILQIGEKRMFRYRTVYFDTHGSELLHEHLRGRLNRVKVRSREYVDTGARFFEVKLKTNKGRTVKHRMTKNSPLDVITPEEARFLASVSTLRAEDLAPVLEVDFKRLTIAGLSYRERITMDLDLTFLASGRTRAVQDLIIVEVKRDGRSEVHTPVLTALRNEKITPSSLSKYCLGMILTGQTQRYNRYKPKLLQLNKLSPHGTIWQPAV